MLGKVRLAYILQRGAAYALGVGEGFDLKLIERADSRFQRKEFGHDSECEKARYVRASQLILCYAF